MYPGVIALTSWFFVLWACLPIHDMNVRNVNCKLDNEYRFPNKNRGKLKFVFVSGKPQVGDQSKAATNDRPFSFPLLSKLDLGLIKLFFPRLTEITVYMGQKSKNAFSSHLRSSREAESGDYAN